MKVLLIEDDQRTASFIIKGLKQEGFVVDHASDGEEGLFMAQKGTYDAAIVDIILPKWTVSKVISTFKVILPLATSITQPLNIAKIILCSPTCKVTY